MIEALIYGWMPSAKIVIWLKAPPENKSMKPMTFPPRSMSCRKNASNAWSSIPGSVMWAPRRYTIKNNAVKMMRCRNSGILRAF